MVCGGVPVATGDIVVGDRDGVVVVPFDRIDATRERLAAVRKAEAEFAEKVKNGLAEVGFVAELLASDRIRHIDN